MVKIMFTGQKGHLGWFITISTVLSNKNHNLSWFGGSFYVTIKVNVSQKCWSQHSWSLFWPWYLWFFFVIQFFCCDIANLYSYCYWSKWLRNIGFKHLIISTSSFLNKFNLVFSDELLNFSKLKKKLTTLFSELWWKHSSRDY